MKVLGKLIFTQVIKSSLFVLLALVALFAFFDLIGQSSKIGTTYSIAQAFMLTALVLPMRCYQVLPIRRQSLEICFYADGAGLSDGAICVCDRRIRCSTGPSILKSGQT